MNETLPEVPGETGKPVIVNGRRESRTFLKDPPVPDSAQKIDALGENLASLFALKRRTLENMRQLWRVYLADCKRLQIEPRKANTSVM